MDIFPERFGKGAVTTESGLPSAGDLFMAVWRDYLDRFGAYMHIAAWMLLLLPFTLPAFLTSVTGVDAKGAIITEQASGSLPFLLTIVGAIAIAVTNIVLRAALNGAVLAGIEGKRLPRNEAVRLGLRVFWPFAGALVLFGIATSIGFAFFFIPGVIIGVYLLFAEQGVALEGLGPIAALKHSAHLVHGRFWAVLWRAAVGCAIIIFASFTVSSVLVQVPTLIFGKLLQSNLTMLRLVLALTSALSVIVTALALPLFVSLQVRMYEALKRTQKKH